MGVRCLSIETKINLMNKSFTLSIFLLLASLSLSAQEYQDGETPIADEFTNLMENSNDYQGFKVVDYDALAGLKAKTAEYIGNLKNEITSQKNTIDQQQNEIAELKRSLEDSEKNLATVTAEKDAITFLGIPFSKGGYMALMWSIILALVLALLFFIFRFKKGHAQTLEAREKLVITEKEFELYRAKALEKEQRLGRLLQDERNKTQS